MSITLVNDGEALLLKHIVNRLDYGNPVMRLYSNPVDITHLGEAITLNNLTECDGYSAAVLTPGGWSVTRSPTSGITTAVYGPVTFSFTDTVQAYGYYVTGKDARGQETLIYLEQFISGGLFQLPRTGGQIAVTTRLSLT